ncbi:MULTISPECIES: aminotransferase family protein [unclassified Streptosporangium]|uniref:aminotransferase family protein n=1 Tax=unclassified Streptosporangium TaxID=2632669 RepID=UPI002E2A5AA2|nr:MULTISPECIES: aminotransferase class III-fold pyridoxal phosphate-dependent enzyme [unclassified Streptosporangium]
MSTSYSALWHPQAHMPSVVDDRVLIVGGDGAYVETSDGRRLLDATAGLWHANVGHGRASIARAAARQMERLETYHLFGRFANEPALELAERVTATGPIADAKVFWTSGGSDAVDLACKLARRHWQVRGRPDKRVIVSRHNSYHGLHGFGTSIGGIPGNREGYGSESLIPETLRVAHSDLDAVVTAIEEAGPERIAALVAEPIIGTGGVITAPEGYLTGLQELCRRHDILFVVDEVITGFGRAGTLFACERFGLRPDMVLVAKGITSGYAPLGGVLIGPRVWEPFFTGDDAPVFRHGITYSGHATACAVARENLDIIERERLVERAAELEPILRAALAPLAEHDLVAEVRCGAGFMAGVRLTKDAPGEAIARASLDRGVITRVLTDNVLQICPPLVVDEADLTLISEAIAASLDHVVVPT